MARPINPDDPGPGLPPDDPDYVPPISSDAKIASIVSSTSIVLTSTQIAAAGGPWPAFKIRVTPINGNGAGPAQSVDYPA